jgi:hypothetical protein
MVTDQLLRRLLTLEAGVLYSYGILLRPAIGAILMRASTAMVTFDSLKQCPQTPQRRRAWHS